MSRGRRVALRVNPDGSISAQPLVGDEQQPGFTVDLEENPALAATIAANQRRDIARSIVDENPAVSAVGAATSGVVDEVTMGLTQIALRAFLEGQDPQEAEMFQMLQEETLGANPTLYAGGRVFGAVAPAFLTGGESLAASGARGLLARGAMLTPGGFAAGMGTLAEQALARGLAGRLTPQLAHAAGITAGAGIDGLIGGTLQAVTDSNISGTPLEAEQVLAYAGLGTMLGLGAGGLLSIPGLARGGLASSQSARLAEAGLDEITPTSSALGIRDVQLPQQEGFDWAFRAAAATSGVDEQTLRRAVASGPEAFDRAALAQRVHATGQTLETTINQADNALSSVTNASRRQQAILAGAEAVDPASLQAVTSSVQRARNTLADLVEGNVATGVARLANEADRRIARELVRQMGRARPGSDLASSVRQVDEILDHVSANNVMSRATPELRAAVAQIQADLMSTSQAGLGTAGQRLAAAHSALTELRNVRRSVSGLVGREMAQGTDIRFHVDRGKLGFALTEQLGEEVRDNTLRSLGDLMVAYNRAIDASEALGVAAPGVREAFDAASERLAQDAAFSKLRTALRHAGIDESQGSGLMASMGFSGRGLGGALAGGLAGGTFGGPAGAVAGAALGGLFGVMSHPVGTLQRLARIRQAMGASQARITSSVSRLKTSMERGSFSQAAGRQLPRTVLALGDPKRREREYRTMLDQVRTLASNPDVLMGRLVDATGPVSEEVHPGLGDNMALSAATGVAYLVSKIPPADQPTPFDHLFDFRPSVVEMDSFVKRVQAVEDPISILDLAASGRLSTEHVEAVATVYPQLYAAMQAEVTQMLSQLNRLPPYPLRLQVGTLLNTPVDSTMDAQFIHAMQQTYAQTAQQDQAQTSVSSRRQVSTRIADHTYSESQELSLRL